MYDSAVARFVPSGESKHLHASTVGGLSEKDANMQS